jgi:hypothetical protein
MTSPIPVQTAARSRGLVALNVALLLVFAAVTLAPATRAQRGTPALAGPARARGEYTMVSGKVTGGSTHAVYLVDANNQELLAMMWSQTNKGLEVIGYRDLHADATAQPGR